MRIGTGDAIELPGRVRRCLKSAVSRLEALGTKDFVNRQLCAPSVHLLARRGKLLRPALVFLGAEALGKDPARFVDLAVAIELFHTSSLIHDDIIDGDETRRGIRTVHARYGREAAILAGDALISKATQLSSRYGADVVCAACGAAMDMCAGEVLDSAYQKAGRMPSVAECVRIASLKSASLIGVSSSIAATYAGSSLAKRMRAFGVNAGIAFQIRDDVLELADGSAAARGGQRTNVVLSLERGRSRGREDAMRRAMALNNRYLDRAVGGVRGSDAELLASCADFIRLSEE